jgi:hypothetical protein
MFARIALAVGGALLLGLVATDTAAQPPKAAAAPDPFAPSVIPLPPGYNGPKYTVSHDYPQAVPPVPSPAPWQQALKGKPIGYDNAIAYMDALKKYVAKDMRTLIMDYANWNAAKAKWYNMPWLYSVTDPIHGTYPAGEFPSNMFPLSNLKLQGNDTMNTYVVVYYNDVAGYTIGQIWGKDAAKPDLSKAQYPEGAIIVKVCITSADKDSWSVMDGAAKWTVYGNPPNAKDPKQLTYFTGSVFQMDLVVKDTKTAPQTGWVFGTLVYDKSVPGDAWDKMIPLGAMWGMDPSIDSSKNPNAILQESVVNPVAPLYSIETLGYGGRLSGPNDGAVVQDAAIDGAVVPRVPASACLSCHSSAQWQMQSFLLPSPSTPVKNGDPNPKIVGGNLAVFKPGSADFNKWFQNRLGNVPMDSGSVGLDFHMNLAFKALPLWAAATGQPVGPATHAPHQLLKTGLPKRVPK